MNEERTIDGLPPGMASLNHILAAVLAGVSENITVGQIVAIVRGDAPAELDTVEKLAAAMSSRVRADAEQTFDATQRSQARANMGVPGRNLIINGQGRINQRAYPSGEATSAANQYTLDRWRVVISGQALTFTGNDSRRVMTAPAGGAEQVIEGANVEGGTYVVSWTGTATCAVNGVAKAKGETFVLAENANATVRFIGGTFTDVQVEVGSVATAFDRKSFGEVRRDCQRYFWRGLANARFNQFTTTTGQSASWHIPFPVTMRDTPVVSISGVTPFGYTAGIFGQPTADGARLTASNSTAAITTANLEISASGYLQADAEL